MHVFELVELCTQVTGINFTLDIICFSYLKEFTDVVNPVFDVGLSPKILI